LILAAERGNTQAVALLLQVGNVDVTCADRQNGYTAFMYTLTSGNRDIVQAFLKSPKKQSLLSRKIGLDQIHPLIWVVQEDGDDTIISDLIKEYKKNGKLEDIRYNGHNPTYYATLSGNTVVQRLLIDAGFKLKNTCNTQ
jgi:ankyrin repeat protein